MTDLAERFSRFLPKDSKFKLFHVQSRGVESRSPVNYQTYRKPKSTLKVKHYLTLTDEEDLVVFGIEVYIYLNIFNDYVDHYIFIAKCDTTGFKKLSFRINYLIKEYIKWLIELDINGYCKDVKLRRGKSQEEQEKDDQGQPEKGQSVNVTIASLNRLIRYLRTDPNFYKSIRYYNKDNSNDKGSLILSSSKNAAPIKMPSYRNIKISLFTRPSDQYLFPNSSKNIHKHIVDGKQLLRWWIDVVEDSLLNPSWKCKLNIPGSDSESVWRFIRDKPKWSIGSIYNKEKDSLAVWETPLFPDDPKGRFLEHLIVENRYKTVTTRQFWNELGFRQEFRLGNLVGIIGCELNDQKIDNNPVTNEESFVLPLKKYRRLLNLIRNENFNSTTDIKTLVNVKISEFLNDFNKHDFYQEVIGNAQHDKNNNLPTSSTNDITSLIRKKEKPDEQYINNLTSSIKRNPKRGNAQPNDLNSLIKRKKK